MKKQILGITILSTLASPMAEACSRIVAPTDHGVNVVRTLDWSVELGSILEVSISKQKRQSVATPEYKKQAKWKVKYRTMNFIEDKVFDGTIAESSNDQGLAASILYQGGSEKYYKKHIDNGAPAVNLHDVIGFISENYSTVQEVLDGLKAKEFQIAWKSTMHEKNSKAYGSLHGLHISFQDKTGHIALIQFGYNGQIIYDNHKGDKDINVMTNDPLVPEMRKENAKIKNLYDLPAEIGPIGRSQRLSFYLDQQKLEGLSKNETEAKLSLVMDTAGAVPMDVSDPKTGLTYQTQIKMQYNLETGEYLYKNYSENREMRFSYDDIKNFKKPMKADLQRQTAEGKIKPVFEAL